MLLWIISRNYFLNLQRQKTSSTDHIMKIDVRDEDDEFYLGHTIDGKVLFPATGYLVSYNIIFILNKKISQLEQHCIEQTSNYTILNS